VVGLIHEGKTGTPAIESAAEFREAGPARVRALPAPDA
jgi:hypothetical protein